MNLQDESIEIRRPYLLFLGGAGNELEAKTALGVAHWRPEDCVGQLRYANCRVDTGLPDMDLKQARRSGARSLLIGVAPTGGMIKPEWESTLCDALESGLDVVSGLHTPLESLPRIANIAFRSGQRLLSVRVPPGDLSVATGRKRSGRRLLTVGTDCCVGKKYTALAIHRALRQAGVDASFRATGQTGILIAGDGIPMDAVVADFLPGAAERLSPDNDHDHWDVIEGQGSLFHPAYAAVTLGLIHGSQPDVMVLCHAAGRTHIDEFTDYSIPGLRESIARYEEAAQLTSPGARCIAVSLNTYDLNDADREEALKESRKASGLPAFDPMVSTPAQLMELLRPELPL